MNRMPLASPRICVGMLLPAVAACGARTPLDIAPTDLQVSLVSNWGASPPNGLAELAGTADARLFGFFDNLTSYVAELDKTTGKARSTTTLTNLAIGSFAMAFWGGDLWLFTNAVATRYTIATSATNVVNSNLGFEVVGAGTSTCAPSGPASQ
jgi:hypothetical protein